MKGASNHPRCIMHLTDQMLAETESIRSRVDFITSKVWVPLEQEVMRRGLYFDEDEDIARATIAELSPYKVRLENILCETDCKEQAY